MTAVTTVAPPARTRENVPDLIIVEDYQGDGVAKKARLAAASTAFQWCSCVRLASSFAKKDCINYTAES
jgi:hypothetical protein